MLIAEPDGTIRMSTPAARTLLARAGIVTDEQQRSLPPSFVARIGEGPPGEPFVFSTGPARDLVHLGCTRYALSGGNWLIVLRDIRDRGRALSEHLHRQRLEATGRLVASIVHDLRMPLGSIVLNASLLEQRPLEETESAAVADIAMAADRMKRSIERLLDFARIGPPVREVLDLSDAIGSTQQLLGGMLRQGGHTVTSSVSRGARRVVANRLVVEQILVNLIVNAVEAAESRPARVRVSAYPDTHDTTCVAVEDDGPGIPGDLHELVFEPFFSTKREGTGLGLATAREAARHMGGDLVLDEATATGARFVLSLPSAEEGSAA